MAGTFTASDAGTWASTGIVSTSVASLGNVNVTSSTVPANGIYTQIASELTFSTQTVARLGLNSGLLFDRQHAGGPDIALTTASGTTPTFQPNRSAANAGIGASSAGNTTIIASNGTGGSGINVLDVAFNAITANIAGVNMPNLGTSSAATTGTLCWTTGTGLVNVDTTAACLVSLEELKNIRAPIGGAEALSDILALKPFWGSWKKSTPEYAGDKAEQPFLGAHQVASVDKRLAAYSPNGALHSVRYQELTAVIVKAVQWMQGEVLGLFVWNVLLTFGFGALAIKVYRK